MQVLARRPDRLHLGVGAVVQQRVRTLDPFAGDPLTARNDGAHGDLAARQRLPCKLQTAAHPAFVFQFFFSMRMICGAIKSGLDSADL